MSLCYSAVHCTAHLHCVLSACVVLVLSATGDSVCSDLLQAKLCSPIHIASYTNTNRKSDPISGLGTAFEVKDVQLVVTEAQFLDLLCLLSRPGALPQLKRLVLIVEPTPLFLAAVLAALSVCPPSVKHFGMYIAGTGFEPNHTEHGDTLLHWLYRALERLRKSPHAAASTLLSGVPKGCTPEDACWMVQVVRILRRCARRSLTPPNLATLSVSYGAKPLMNVLAPCLEGATVEQVDSICEEQELERLVYTARAKHVLLRCTFSDMHVHHSIPRAETPVPAQAQAQGCHLLLVLNSADGRWRTERMLRFCDGLKVLDGAHIRIILDFDMPESHDSRIQLTALAQHLVHQKAGVVTIQDIKGSIQALPHCIPPSLLKEVEFRIDSATTIGAEVVSQTGHASALRMCLVGNANPSAVSMLAPLAKQVEQLEMSVLAGCERLNMTAPLSVVQLLADTVEHGNASVVLLLAENEFILLHLLSTLLMAHARRGRDQKQRLLRALGLGCLTPVSKAAVDDIDTLLLSYLGGGRVYFNSKLVRGRVGGQAYVPPATFQQRCDVALGVTPLGLWAHGCPFHWLSPDLV